uniref:DUF2845 domain-containing protein n=1 Tax=Ningiella ruwaisensis TaxID=2364274 RepID=UPI00109F594A|nr:DUF2845 domain-containing protein [Ningiella ruwaisensis]
MKIFASVVFTIFMFMSLLSEANSFRCENGNLVREGDLSLEVISSCGDPDAREYVGKVKINGKYVNVDQYLYIPAKGQFVKIIEFHDGKVVKITNGRRVQ